MNLSMVKKTKFMIINTGKNNINITNKVRINRQDIDRVHRFRYLGVELDDELRFEYQIDAVASKAAMKINLMKRISNRLTFRTKKIVYNTIISPNFEYCSTLYLNATKEQIDQLQQLQNRAMRIILNCGRLTHRLDMLNALDWLSVSQRIKYNAIIMVYKMKRGLAPKYMNDNVNLVCEIHSRNTRNRNNYRLPLVRTEQMKKNIFYNGLKMYNELPQHMKEMENINAFKKECSKYVKEKFEII